tara:strand:+ start:341 stop:1741 length:1401 start_codon:yes stop_codon:yes gene_type:complete
MEILLTGGDTKCAKDLKVGDKIETLDQHTLKRGEHKVTYVRVVESPLLSLKLSGKTFKCSEEDVFYSAATSEWVKATELKKGDRITKLEGESIVEDSKKLGKGPSIELTVDDAHTYVCDGVLLHNKGGKKSPPPPKTYTQGEVDAMKKQWGVDSQAKYDKRYAGDKLVWEAQRDRDRAVWEKDYAAQQRSLYDDRFKTAKGEWHTAAEQRYDDRFDKARGDWQTTADAAYADKFQRGQTEWQRQADLLAAEKEAAWADKYGQLETKYGEQGKEYADKLRKSELSFRHENQSRLDLLDRYNVRGDRLDKLRGKHGQLEDRYGDLEGRYGDLTGRYGDLEGRHGDLTGRYKKKGRDYDTLAKDYDQRGRDYDELTGNYGKLKGKYGHLQDKHKAYKDAVTANRGERDHYDTGVMVTYVRDADGNIIPPKGGNERPRGGPAPGLSSDEERRALLTGDYSKLNAKYDPYR